MKHGAVPMPKSPPSTVRLTGKHALPFHGTKPGGAVSAHVSGTLSNVGFDEYDGNKPTATIAVHGVKNARKIARRVRQAGGR